MNELILFVLKSTIVSGVLCTWYMLALRNKRLHRYNRFFLLFALYASIHVPLLDFTWSPAYEQTPQLFTSAKVLLHTLDSAYEAPPATQHARVSDITWEAIVIGIAA